MGEQLRPSTHAHPMYSRTQNASHVDSTDLLRSADVVLSSGCQIHPSACRMDAQRLVEGFHSKESAREVGERKGETKTEREGEREQRSEKLATSEELVTILDDLL